MSTQSGAVVQIGIISMGVPHCGPRFPQLLSRVDQIAPWVTLWIEAVERGAPAPEIVIPEVQLPRLTISDARRFATEMLVYDFGNRIRKSRGYEIGCVRRTREKAKCFMGWVRGPHYYRGAATVYTAVPQEGSIYNIRYKIRRFGLNCWLRYLNPKRWCRPTLFYR
jgi:hypothetical protein